MMMNIMDTSNFINHKNDFTTIGRMPKENKKNDFSKVLSSEKRNFLNNNQNNVKKSMQDKNPKNTNISNKRNSENPTTRSLDEHSKVTDKENTKDTKKSSSTENKKLDKPDKYEDLTMEDVEKPEEESIDKESIAILLQSILSIIENNDLDTSDENKNLIENLEGLKEELSLLLDTNHELLDETIKEKIDIVFELINKISHENLLVDNKQIDLQKQNIKELLNNLEDLKNHIEPILKESTTIKIDNMQKIDLKDSKFDLEEKELVESKELLEDSINTDKTEKTNVKVVDKFMLTDGDKSFSEEFEGDNEILFKEQILLSQQELKNQSINLKVEKNEIIEAKQFINQIAQKAGGFLSKDRNEMSIQLTPENLGKISIKIGLNEGSLTGKIYAENYAVKEIIETNLNQLRDSLEEQGLNIAGLEVHIGDNPQNFNRSLYEPRFTNRQRSKVSPIGGNNNFVTLEERAIQTNPYLNTNQFDSLV